MRPNIRKRLKWVFAFSYKANKFIGSNLDSLYLGQIELRPDTRVARKLTPARLRPHRGIPPHGQKAPPLRILPTPCCWTCHDTSLCLRICCKMATHQVQTVSLGFTANCDSCSSQPGTRREASLRPANSSMHLGVAHNAIKLSYDCV